MKQTREWHLVIMQKTDNKKLSEKEIETALNMYTSYYFIILHDKDTNEHGELKKPHFHIVIKTRKRITKGGILRDLSNLLSINVTAISAKETINEIASIRYLLHLDQPNKEQYPRFCILTKRNDLLNSALDGKQVSEELSATLLIEIVKENRNRLKIMEKIGLNQYTRYRGVIADIIFQLEDMEAEEKSKYSAIITLNNTKDIIAKNKRLAEKHAKKLKEDLQKEHENFEKKVNEKATELLNKKRNRK